MNLWLLRLMMCTIVLPAAFAGPATQSQPIDAGIEQLSRAATPEELAHSCGLLNDIPASRLNQLTANHDCAVALAAAWERVRRTVPAERLSQSVRVEKEAIARFVGFVEGRLQLAAPRRWAAAVESAFCYGRSSIVFWRPEEADPRLARGSEGPRLISANIRNLGDAWEVTVEGRTWPVPRTIAMGDKDRASVAQTDGMKYVAVYASTPNSYFVFAVDEVGGTPKWSAEVWADGGSIRSYTGPISHEVKLQVLGDTLLVFGVASNVAYIEAFNAKTGASMWRFGTLYFRQ